MFITMLQTTDFHTFIQKKIAENTRNKKAT